MDRAAVLFVGGVIVGLAIGALVTYGALVRRAEDCQINPPNPIEKVNQEHWQLRSVSVFPDGQQVWYVCRP
jgi:hypothetical protein